MTKSEFDQEYVERIWGEAKLLFLHEGEGLISTLVTLAYADGMDAGIEAEREECAKVCENDGLLWGQRYAAAIRARGEA